MVATDRNNISPILQKLSETLNGNGNLFINSFRVKKHIKQWQRRVRWQGRRLLGNGLRLLADVCVCVRVHVCVFVCMCWNKSPAVRQRARDDVDHPSTCWLVVVKNGVAGAAAVAAIAKTADK